MDIIVQKKGINWLLSNVSFSANGLVYEKAIPLQLQELTEEKQEIESRLAEAPTDEELLEWAKENHPQMQEIRQLEERLGEIEARIEELSKLSFEE